MAKPLENHQKHSADSSQPAKKKVVRKRVAKKSVPAATTSAKEPALKEDKAAKKKVVRKRVVNKPEPVVEKGGDATSTEAPEVQSSEDSKVITQASKPEKGEVRRESGTQNAERQEDGDKKRRRRRRRRGGDGRDDEIRGEHGGDERSKDEQPEGRDDEKENRSTGHRVSVRQPEIQRQHDRRPPRYTENPELIAKYAWQLYKGEIREEGGTLIDDRDAKKIAERAFRMAEIFLMEESRMG